MDRKINTPRAVCRAIVAVAVAAIAVAAIIGCSSFSGGSRKANIATVIQTAYDMGGREAVSNKIESLVAEGKLTPSQAIRLHALAQLAYEGIMDDLAAGGTVTNAPPPTCSQGGCTDCSVPDASGGSGGECNEDANCGKCTDCEDR
ncbi:MAG: hypothetical protein J6M06_00290 [Synergistaceae bacterium]|jgi:hypothetical protein|nr:hypothetical protein [Synergistaceae bacterium]